MALNPKLSAASRNLALNAALDVLNSGHILILDGTQATDADTAIGAQVTLAQLTFGATAWAAASAGSKSANSITQDSSADATGTASWYRMRTSGNTAVWDGTCGTSSANLNFNSVAIQSGAAVSISSFTATMAA
jgi:hypothetical protein